MVYLAVLFSIFSLVLGLPIFGLASENQPTQETNDSVISDLHLSISLPPWLSREDLRKILDEVEKEDQRNFTTKNSLSGTNARVSFQKKRASVQLDKELASTVIDLSDTLDEYYSGSIDADKFQQEAIAETVQNMSAYVITRSLDKGSLSLSRSSRKAIGKVLGMVVISTADLLRSKWNQMDTSSPTDPLMYHDRATFIDGRFEKIELSFRIPF